MITEFLIWVMAGVARLVLTLFPAGPASQPAADAVQSGIATVFGFAAQLTNWVPLSSFGPAILLVVAVLAVAAVIKLVRIVASFLTLGGGSAA